MGTLIEPPVGTALSRLSVSVVLPELLPAASVACSGIVGAPEAPLAQVIAVES